MGIAKKLLFFGGGYLMGTYIDNRYYRIFERRWIVPIEQAKEDKKLHMAPWLVLLGTRQAV